MRSSRDRERGLGISDACPSDTMGKRDGRNHSDTRRRPAGRRWCRDCSNRRIGSRHVVRCDFQAGSRRGIRRSGSRRQFRCIGDLQRGQQLPHAVRCADSGAVRSRLPRLPPCAANPNSRTSRRQRGRSDTSFGRSRGNTDRMAHTWRTSSSTVPLTATRSEHASAITWTGLARMVPSIRPPSPKRSG